MPNVSAMVLNGISALRATLARAVLLLALLLAGMVPDGMMRQAGPDGMGLVLCTTDGPQEVLLSADGQAIPVEPGQTTQPPHDPHCVQVNLIAQAVDLPITEPLSLRFWQVSRPVASHQVAHRQVAGDARRTRAPPRLV